MSGVMAFFVFVFLMSQIVAIAIQGGGVSSTRLTTTLDVAQTTVMRVGSTANFLNATVPIPAHVLVISPSGKEFIKYTGRPENYPGDPPALDYTTFTGLTRGVVDPQTNEQNEAVTHTVSANSTPAVLTTNLDVINSFVGYNVGTAQGVTGGIEMVFVVGKALLFSLPRMLTWDYPWLQGQAAILRVPLYALSAGFVFSLFMAAIGVAQGLLRI